MAIDLKQRLGPLAAAIGDHLAAGIIPFWQTRAADRECGGFLTNFDAAGNALECPEKYLNTQCRLTWWFSHLYRHEHDQAHAALARHGAEFLLRHFWDDAHGGWFWKTRRDGSRLDDGKIVYGQSFAIYAMAEYFLATGDQRGLDRASQTFDLLQRHCADTRYGGYLENLNADWTPESDGFAGGDRKSLDTHMHLMESFTVLFAATQSPLHRRKLLEVTDLIHARMIDRETGCGLNHFDRAWNPIPAIAIKRTWNAERIGDKPAAPTDTTSYGHNTELSWLMRRALDTAGAAAAPYQAAMRRLLDHALTHGIDWEFGGIYRDGLRNGGPLVREKEFWQHAEALVGFVDGYEQFADVRYLDAFEKLWNFVAAHMIVPGVGEWRTLLSREGEAIDANIGNPWKVSYHSGRAVLECARRLGKLIGAR